LARKHPFRALPFFGIGALTLIIASLVGAYLLAREHATANERTARSIEIQISMVRVLERTRALRSAVHPSELTGNEAVNLSFVRYLDDIRLALARAEALNGNNPRFQQRLDALATALQREFTGGLAASGGSSLIPAAMTVSNGPLGAQGQALLDRMDSELTAMIDDEEARLQADIARGKHYSALLGEGLLLAMVLIFLVAWHFLRSARRSYVALAAARDDARLAAQTAQAEITARVAAESHVRQLQKMESIGQLTGGIAHDFNNMLAIIIGSLDLAERRLDDRSRLERHLANAREGADRAAALTARLLSFSRRQALSPDPVDDNRLTRGMLDLLYRTVGEAYQLSTQLSPDLWPTFADTSQLENAILNLVVNSRDALTEGGDIRITTRNVSIREGDAAVSDVPPGQWVAIRVADNGHGMTKEVMERCFDPFFTTKEPGKGTGLGLSQVFGFLKQSGGHVVVSSEVGEGTEVTLYLPRHAGKLPDSGDSQGEDMLPRGDGRELILVVEDEERVRRFSVEALQELGYRVIAAENGLEALRLLRSNPRIDLLFTDIVMPEMNGLRLAEHARQLRPRIRTLFSTGYTQEDFARNKLDILPKPFTMGQLARKVRAVLDGQPATQVSRRTGAA